MSCPNSILLPYCVIAALFSSWTLIVSVQKGASLYKFFALGILTCNLFLYMNILIKIDFEKTQNVVNKNWAQMRINARRINRE